MAPRDYSLGKRAVQVANTRERILEAAMSLYRDQGIRATSMHDVARRADVVPATVLNHFATADELAETVLQRILGALRVPTPEIFSGVRSSEERIRRLVWEMFAFYHRSDDWYVMYQREVNEVPAIKVAEGRFWESIQALYATALGPLLSHETLGPTVFGLTSPATLGALRASGLTLEQASDVIGRMLAGLIDEALI